MTRFARGILLAVALSAVAIGLAGCGSSSPETGSVPPSISPTSATTPAGSDTATPTTSSATGGSDSGEPLSTVHVRIANLFDPKGKPGPALDVYDVQLNNLNGAPATPILTDVAYGTVSAYAQPHLTGTVPMKVVELEALPTGDNPDTQSADATPVGGVIDDGSGARWTELLTASDDSLESSPMPLSGMSTSERMEAGDDGQGGDGPAAPPAPAGKAELLVDASDITQTGSLSFYLSIDSSCAPPLNGAPDSGNVPEIFAADGVAPKSSFAVFATTPGAHSVSVESWTSSTPPTCTQLTPKQGTTSISLTSGEQTEVYLYGTPKDLHFALAPIQAS